MDMVTKVAMAGGLFVVFGFIHFFVDWVFQSHAEAMVKHNNPKVRAKHCAIYTAGFIPLMWVLGFNFWDWVIGLNILFWSHFAEDTYIPVYLWAKFIRKPPEMSDVRKEPGPDGYVFVLPPDPKKGFGEFVQTPLGKILMIAIDQIVHLAFLWPLVYLAMRNK